MPLRITPEETRPAEPTYDAQPSSHYVEEEHFVRRREPEQPRSDKGTLVLKIIVGCICTYVGVMVVGLLGMMFPHQTHEIVRAVRQGVAMVRPEQPRQRVVVAPVQNPAPDKVATAPRKRPRRVESPNFRQVQVVDANRKQTITPRPADPLKSVTVSVEDSQ